MAIDFSLVRFAPLVGADFTVLTTHGAFKLTLREARELPRRGLPEQFRTPLSLIFDGPSGVVLAHDNYTIAHPAIGEHALDIAPVMPAPGAPGTPPGMPQYQILFA